MDIQRSVETHGYRLDMDGIRIVFRSDRGRHILFDTGDTGAPHVKGRNKRQWEKHRALIVSKHELIWEVKSILRRSLQAHSRYVLAAAILVPKLRRTRRLSKPRSEVFSRSRKMLTIKTTRKPGKNLQQRAWTA